MKLGPEFLSVLPLERSNVKIHWLRNFFVKMLKGGWKIKSFNEYSVLSFHSRLLVMIFAYLSTQKRRFPPRGAVAPLPSPPAGPCTGPRLPAGLEPAPQVLASEQPPRVVEMDYN